MVRAAHDIQTAFLLFPIHQEQALSLQGFVHMGSPHTHTHTHTRHFTAKVNAFHKQLVQTGSVTAHSVLSVTLIQNVLSELQNKFHIYSILTHDFMGWGGMAARYLENPALNLPQRGTVSVSHLLAISGMSMASRMKQKTAIYTPGK